MAKDSASNKTNLLIILLVIVAFILGFLIYKKTVNIAPHSMQQSNQQSSNREVQQSQGYTTRRPTPAGLSDEEKKVMNPPRQSSSEKEKNAYFDLVSSIATPADTLELNKCEKPDPLVMKLKVDQNFKIYNSDTKNHTIILNPNLKIEVKAGETKNVKADFGKGGYFGYLCDEIGGLVGVFVLQGSTQK